MIVPATPDELRTSSCWLVFLSPKLASLDPVTRTFACLIELALLGGCAMAPPSVSTTAAERAILDTEMERVAAVKRGDCDRQAAILSDDFVEVGAGGVVRTKAQNVADCRVQAVRFERYEVSNLTVHVYGDAAVVVGDANLAGTYRDAPFTRRTRYLRVYVRTDGVWHCVAAEGTILSEHEPR